MKHFLFIYLSYFLSYSIYAQDKTIDQNIIDDDITLEKKSLIILTAAYDEDQDVAERVLSIMFEIYSLCLEFLLLNLFINF